MEIYIKGILKTTYEISNFSNTQLIIANIKNLSKVEIEVLKTEYSVILYEILIKNNKRVIKIVYSLDNLYYMNIYNKYIMN